MNPGGPLCRSCGLLGLISLIDMGRTPLANALLAPEQLDRPEPVFPLELAFCPHCSLVQILETVPPDQLFREYLYLSSFSDTMLQHAGALTRHVMAWRRLDKNSLVIEAASNDGYLLKNYRQAGVPVLGIEPARNVAQAAREKHGIPTREEFFTETLARELRAEGKCAAVFHAHNVLAHVPDLNGFVRGIRNVLRDDGLAIVEVPYVKDLIDHVEFDTIYHEHLCYFSLTALDRLFRRHHLVIQDVEHLRIHGGSLRLYAVPGENAHEQHDRVRELLQEELAWGVDSAAFYLAFTDRVQALKMLLCGLLTELKHGRKRLAAYGASAKGSTLLNYCGIGREILDFVVDRSTIKQGRYTPGSHLPIHAPEKLLEVMPDFVLLLTWNFAEEIMRQQVEYRRRGGQFITPIPELKVA